MFAESDGIGGHAVPDRRVEMGCRCDLDHFLVAPLHGAVALVQVDHVAGAVAENLHLDVARTLDELLDEHGPVAKSGEGFGAGAVEHLLHLVHLADHPHASTTTSVRGFEDDREAVLATEVHRLLSASYWLYCPLNDGN